MPDRHRALALLADLPNGATEATMLAHGFTSKLILALVRAGLAAMKIDHMLPGVRPVDVTRIRITDAGRRALAEGS